ncbi:hypothetical protein STEG23_016633 [Scotinomys teguina]
MVAAIAIMVKDAGKLTLGQPLTVIAPHAVESLVKQPPDWWMLNAHMTHYQALLLDTDQTHLQALQLVQNEVWKPLASAYREELKNPPPPVPHPFKLLPISPFYPYPLHLNRTLPRPPPSTRSSPEKTPPKNPTPVLPPDPNSPLIDLLTNEPPPYPGNQGPVVHAPPAGESRTPAPPTAPTASSMTGPAASTPQDSREPASSPIAGRLRERRDGPPTESRAFPLREGPNDRLQYWPFSASDLYNWKQHNPPFSKDPTALTNLIESILVTHRPTWEDCQQLLRPS